MSQNLFMLKTTFQHYFNNEATDYLFIPSRLEIIGNHTDHQRGLCLVANASVGIEAVFRKNDDTIVHLFSKGYDEILIDIAGFTIRENEVHTSQALIRGVSSYFMQKGYQVAGFNAYLLSNIPSGIGLSSSAAFSLFVANALNILFNDNQISPLELVYAARYSENHYFKKQSGLLDQIGISFPGINFLDLEDEHQPLIEKVPYNLPLSIYLVDTGSHHLDSTHLYESIRNDYEGFANKYFKRKDLRAIKEEELYHLFSNPHIKIPYDLQKRVQHFYDENNRVLLTKQALIRHDLDTFLMNINFSGLSSSQNLKNTLAGPYKTSPERALKLARQTLTKGACRVHGGGFQGAIICFVPKEEEEVFLETMFEVYKEKRVFQVDINEEGIKHLCLENS